MLEGTWLALVSVVCDEVVDGGVEVGLFRDQAKHELYFPAE